MSKKANGELTNKQKVFVIEYCRDFNGLQAAIKAGYSRKTARVIAQENLLKPAIQEKIAAILQKREEEAELQVKDLQRYWKNIMFTKVTDVISFNESGVSFNKNSDEIDPDVALSLESVEVIESFSGNDKSILRTKVKMKDALKASENYGRTIGAFRDKIDHTFETPEERLRRLKVEK
jgi:phage terminase small subunit